MEIKKTAMAGTLESSDAQVTVEPGDGTIELTIESSVIHQYGRQIRKVTLETLDRLGVDNAKVTIHRAALPFFSIHYIGAFSVRQYSKKEREQ